MAIEEEKIEEIKEILNIKESLIKKQVKIVFDGKQYNIRIPLKYAQKVKLDPNKDVFEFELVLPDFSANKLPTLIGRLKKQ